MYHNRTSLWVVIAVFLGLSILTGCQPTNAILRSRAVDALRRSDQPAAVALYQQALKQNPTDWRALAYMAKYYTKQQQWIDAQHAYERVLSIQPDHALRSTWLDSLAQCLFEQHRSLALRTMLQDATQTYGQSSDFLRQANYLVKLGEIDQAHIAYLKAAQFADDHDAEPYIAMVAFYEQIGDKAKVIDALRRAHWINPDNQEIASRLRHYGIVPGPAAGMVPQKLK